MKQVNHVKVCFSSIDAGLQAFCFAFRNFSLTMRVFQKLSAVKFQKKLRTTFAGIEQILRTSASLDDSSQRYAQKQILKTFMKGRRKINNFFLGGRAKDEQTIHRGTFFFLQKIESFFFLQTKAITISCQKKRGLGLGHSCTHFPVSAPC